MTKQDINQRIEAMTRKLAQAFLDRERINNEIDSLKEQIQIHQAYLVEPENDEVDV